MFIICNNRGERLYQFGPYMYYENALRALNNNQGRGFHIVEEDNDEEFNQSAAL